MRSNPALQCLIFLGSTASSVGHLQAWQLPFSQPGWAHGDDAAPDQKMVVILALREHNLPFLTERARRVSDPTHPSYGRYWSRDDVTELATPSRQALAVVQNYLAASDGIIKISKSKSLVKFVCSVICVERFFNTTLKTQKGKTALGTSTIRAATPIYVPHSVADLLDGISLNAPIFMPPKPQQPKPALFTYPASQRKPPRIRPHLLGGDQSISFYFVAYCRNGTANWRTLEEGICGGSGESDRIVSFEILVLQHPNLQHPVVLPAVTAIFGQRRGRCEGGTPCQEFNVTVGALSNYRNTTVVMRSHFNDGSVTEFSLTEEVQTIWPMQYTTPDFLSRYYNMPLNMPIRHERNSVSVAEFFGQYYNPNDMQKFFKLAGVRALNNLQTRVVGRNEPLAGSAVGSESQLDLQYIAAMASNVTAWFWSVQGEELATEQEPFLTWLMQVSDMDDDSIPLVHSVSYADDEAIMPVWFKERVNSELMKLALRGITVISASGDDGASGNLLRTMNDQKFCRSPRPVFPASSPWITATGGTQLSMSASPMCGYNTPRLVVNCHYEAEVAASSQRGAGISTGGGFSNHFDMPWYQQEAVKPYILELKHASHPNSSWQYNPSGRAYPDISAIANNYLVLMGDELHQVSGTSASTPLIAAMVAHWNEIRLQRKQPPLGFLNPLLYHVNSEHPEAFNDILMGDNRCSETLCCENGFTAKPGWDAVTGIGSPRFDNWLSILKQNSESGVQLPSPDVGITSFPTPVTSLLSFSQLIGIGSAVIVALSVCFLGRRKSDGYRPNSEQLCTAFLR